MSCPLGLSGREVSIWPRGQVPHRHPARHSISWPGSASCLWGLWLWGVREPFTYLSSLWTLCPTSASLLRDIQPVSPLVLNLTTNNNNQYLIWIWNAESIWNDGIWNNDYHVIWLIMLYILVHFTHSICPTRKVVICILHCLLNA